MGIRSWILGSTGLALAIATACSDYSGSDEEVSPVDAGGDVAPSDAPGETSAEASASADAGSDAALFAARVVNASCRVDVAATRDVATFVLDGSGTKRVAIRVLGPSLSAFGIANALANPVLEVFDATSTSIAKNDDWQDDPPNAAAVQAAAVDPGSPQEPAVVLTLGVGSFRVRVYGKDGGQGVALVEIFDLDHASPASSRIRSFSAQGTANPGDEALIGGMLVAGTTAVPLLVRGLGASLEAQQIANALADPLLDVRDSQKLVASNDDWTTSNDRDAIAETGAAPPHPLEPAVLVSLAGGPGGGASAYTVLVRTKDGGSGVAVVDFVDLRKSP